MSIEGGHIVTKPREKDEPTEGETIYETQPLAGVFDKPERQRILEEALRLTLGDRNKQYGEPRVNLTQCADLWSAYTGVPLKAYQVSIMMVLAKISRISHNPGHTDNYVDGAAYMAIAREVCDSYSEGSK